MAGAVAQVLSSMDGVMVLAEGHDPRHRGISAERIRALPVSDRASVAVAVGAALGGAKPVVELAGPARIFAVLEVLREAAAVARHGEHAVPMLVRVPWGHEAGALDAAVLDVLGAIDGLQVVCPRGPSQAAALTHAALSGRSPVVLLEPRALAQRGQVEDTTVALGRCDVVRNGRDVTLAAFGTGVAVALQAAATLEASGMEAEVVDLVSLAPVDADGLGASVQRTGRLIVATPEADVSFARRVCRVGLDGAFLHLEAPLVAGPDNDPVRLADAAQAAIQY